MAFFIFTAVGTSKVSKKMFMKVFVSSLQFVSKLTFAIGVIM
jgi:hypothetical protein